jgi:hypothetical protein
MHVHCLNLLRIVTCMQLVQCKSLTFMCIVVGPTDGYFQLLDQKSFWQPLIATRFVVLAALRINTASMCCSKLFLLVYIRHAMSHCLAAYTGADAHLTCLRHRFTPCSLVYSEWYVDQFNKQAAIAALQKPRRIRKEWGRTRWRVWTRITWSSCASHVKCLSVRIYEDICAQHVN